MKLIEPSFKIEYLPEYGALLNKLEYFLRNCYKSEGRVDDGMVICPMCNGAKYEPLEDDESPPAPGILRLRNSCGQCKGFGRVHDHDPSCINMIRKYVTRMDDISQVREALFKAGLGRFVPSLSFHDAHEGVLEHDVITVRFIANRGFLAEMTRHRHASFLVESTRYCLYVDEEASNKNQEVTFIHPNFWPTKYPVSALKLEEWEAAMRDAQDHYTKLIALGAKPEEARDVLNMGLKTDIIETANIREWRYILRLRTSKRAHPQMRELTKPLLRRLKESYPVLFEDIYLEE